MDLICAIGGHDQALDRVCREGSALDREINALDHQVARDTRDREAENRRRVERVSAPRTDEHESVLTRARPADTWTTPRTPTVTRRSLYIARQQADLDRIRQLSRWSLERDITGTWT